MLFEYIKTLFLISRDSHSHYLSSIIIVGWHIHVKILPLWMFLKLYEEQSFSCEQM